MNSLLLTVIIVIILILLYSKLDLHAESYESSESSESFESSKVVPVDMISFKAKDPIQAKYTMQWDQDDWGLNSAEKYYENLAYYNNGLSSFDPADSNGRSMFSDPAGAPALPGMSEVDRLGYEVLGDQANPTDMKFSAPKVQDSMEDLVS